MQNECGDDSLYCPSGSGAPMQVQPLYYTTGGTATTRTDQAFCEGTAHTGAPPSGILRENFCPSTTFY